MTMEKEKISQVNFKMPEKDKKEVTAIFKYYGLDLSNTSRQLLRRVTTHYFAGLIEKLPN